MPVFDRDGQRLAYDIHGKGERCVVLVHNLFTNRTIFASHFVALSKRYRVIAVDLRGHGASTPVTRPFSTRDLGADLGAILDHANVRQAVFVGVSLGACASMELAMSNPSRVRAMVLMGATGWSATGRERVLHGVTSTVIRGIGVPSSLARVIATTLFGETFRYGHKSSVDAWVRTLSRTARIDGSLAMRAWAMRPALITNLRSLKQPTLVVVGSEDTSCPHPHGAAIQSAITHATLERIEEAGHTLPLEQPERTLACIESMLYRSFEQS